MSTLPVNSRILEYKITEHLGSGGFAHTYRALDVNLDKVVTVKEFFPARLCARDAEFRVEPQRDAEERFAKYLGFFIEEARILAKFDHPNIVKVLRYFEALGTAYIIMEFVDGRPMSDYFAFDNVLGEERVSRWLTGILDGLKVVHEAEIIHGDIKPRNILITEADEAVLIDFGASVIYKAAQDNDDPIEELHLSRSYAAPEQFVQGARLDRRLDIYGLGAVFYHAITGEKPEGAGADGPDVAVDILRYKRFYNQKLLSSIARAMQPDPADRFVDASAWLDFITLSLGERALRGIRRHNKLIASLLLLLAGVSYATYYVEANQIDARNYYYKLFAGQDEVLGHLQRTDRYLEKLRDAESYLATYANEFSAQLRKIDEGNLTTGRNSIAALRNYEPAVNRTQQEVRAAMAEIDRLRDLYYFDDVASPLVRVNQQIMAFGERQPEFNTRLLSAYVEDEIVSRARQEQLDIDAGQLAELINALRDGEPLQDLGALVPVALPIVTDFLQEQRLAADRRRFESSRERTIEKIRDIAEPLRRSSRFKEFEAAEEMARAAERDVQLDMAVGTAEALATEIKAEQRRAEARRTAQKRQSEKRTVVNAIDASMIGVPADRFTMGSNRHGYAIPPHPVEVYEFHIQRHEVTIAQWRECVKDKACPVPEGASDKPDFPVTGISWDATQSFTDWLNDTSTRFRYRLVSEAEWEYVVKKYGYVLKELEGGLTSVGAQGANSLGIKSIMGNALEWLEDCWHGGYLGAPTDSRAWVRGFECSRRVVRGANWEGTYTLTRENASYFRPAGLDRSETRPTLGFRLAADRR